MAVPPPVQVTDRFACFAAVSSLAWTMPPVVGRAARLLVADDHREPRVVDQGVDRRPPRPPTRSWCGEAIDPDVSTMMISAAPGRSGGTGVGARPSRSWTSWRRPAVFVLEDSAVQLAIRSPYEDAKFGACSAAVMLSCPPWAFAQSTGARGERIVACAANVFLTRCAGDRVGQ
jgi:hypothetical protein